MMEYTYSEQGILPGVAEYDPTSVETGACSLSKGSFSLRRAHYFNDIRHKKIISDHLPCPGGK